MVSLAIEQAAALRQYVRRLEAAEARENGLKRELALSRLRCAELEDVARAARLNADGVQHHVSAADSQVVDELQRQLEHARNELGELRAGNGQAGVLAGQVKELTAALHRTEEIARQAEQRFQEATVHGQEGGKERMALMQARDELQKRAEMAARELQDALTRTDALKADNTRMAEELRLAKLRVVDLEKQLALFAHSGAPRPPSGPGKGFGSGGGGGGLHDLAAQSRLNAVLKENLALRQMNQEAAQFEGGHRPLHHARSTPYLPAAVPSNFSSPYLSPHHDYRPGGRPISHSAPVGHLGFDDYPSHYDDHGRHGGGLPADLRHAGLGGPGHDHDLF